MDRRWTLHVAQNSTDLSQALVKVQVLEWIRPSAGRTYPRIGQHGWNIIRLHCLFMERGMLRGTWLALYNHVSFCCCLMNSLEIEVFALFHFQICRLIPYYYTGGLPTMETPPHFLHREPLIVLSTVQEQWLSDTTFDINCPLAPVQRIYKNLFRQLSGSKFEW